MINKLITMLMSVLVDKIGSTLITWFSNMKKDKEVDTEVSEVERIIKQINDLKIEVVADPSKKDIIEPQIGELEDELRKANRSLGNL